MREPRLTRLPRNLSPSGGALLRWQAAAIGMTVAELIACGVLLRDIHHYNRLGKIAFDPPLPVGRPGSQPKSQRPRCYAERGYSRPRRAPSGNERPCLRCGQPFASDGAHHRLCDGCRQTVRDVSPFAPD